MKVRMKTLLAGPDQVLQPGQEVALPDAEAQQLIAGGYAISVDMPAPEPAREPDPEAAPDLEPAGEPEPVDGESALELEEEPKQEPGPESDPGPKPKRTHRRN